ncbi:hypothetical protein ID866_756 [Astraeus odoratus]|nr:hypothetical protein ID866_756 [Astraeus odoratus]
MTPREDRTYGSVQKSRRSPPGGDSQNNGFFQQGLFFYIVFVQYAQLVGSPRIVSGHYSIPYVQSRSSTTKTDHTTSTYPQWPSSTTRA